MYWIRIILDTSISCILDTSFSRFHFSHDSFLKVVQAKFVKVKAFNDADDWDKVGYEDPDNQLPDENMTVGFLAKQKFQELLNESDIAPGDSRKFFNAARAFYTSTVDYFKPHVPQ